MTILSEGGSAKILLVEELRSRKKYIINDIAEKFKGGGHPLASGAKVRTDDPEKLVNEVLNHLEERVLNGN